MEANKNIPGWFDEKSEEVLLALIKKHDVKTVIEVGSFLGRSAVFFAQHCEKVYCVDPFVMWDEGSRDGTAVGGAGTNEVGKSFYDRFLAYTKPYPNIIPIRASSQEAASLLPQLKADMVYIDGAHDFVSVANDIQLWAPRARRVLSGDDYGDAWPDVRSVVNLTLPGFEKADDGSLVWYYEKAYQTA